jgi:hypothetical protein
MVYSYLNLLLHCLTGDCLSTENKFICIHWYTLPYTEHTGGIEMNVVPVRLPDKIIEEIDKMVQEGFYSNRSGAIRIIVTRYVLEETEKKKK